MTALRRAAVRGSFPVMSDPRLTAHKMPAQMANEALLDLIGSGEAIVTAIIEDHGPDAVARIRETALAQAEAYIDLTAQAATFARALKP